MITTGIKYVITLSKRTDQTGLIPPYAALLLIFFSIKTSFKLNFILSNYIIKIANLSLEKSATLWAESILLSLDIGLRTILGLYSWLPPPVY